jgi:hypothetical protein
MNEPDFLEALSKEWQRDTQALDVMRCNVKRQRWFNRLFFSSELMWGCIGVGWAWYFWQKEATVFKVSAVVLLVCSLFGLWISVRNRLPMWHVHDWSPEGLLAYRVRMCEYKLRGVHYCIYGAAALLLFLTYIWVNEYIEPESTPSHFPLIYTVIVLWCVFWALFWARLLRRGQTEELAKLRALLHSFNDSETKNPL